MIGLREWARSTPLRRSARDVLGELDHLQQPVTPTRGAVHRKPSEESVAERTEALGILVRRGVISAEVAEAVREAPVGAAAAAWTTQRPDSVPRTRTPRARTAPAVRREPDPAGPIGVALVLLAPAAALLVVADIAGTAAVMWISTFLLLAGAIVLAVSGGRHHVNTHSRRGRYSPAQLTALASFALLAPLVTVAIALADLAAADLVGACLGYQAMTIVVLYGLASVARRQERAA